MARDEWLVAVLLSSPVSCEQIEAIAGPAVERREGRHDLPEKPGHSIVARSSNRSVVIDIFSHQWHDSSGEDSGPTSPMYSHNPEHDHLLADPWSLKRAVQQYRGPDDAAIDAANHSAYLLLRVRDEDAGAFEFLVEVARKLLRGLERSCFFNPRGESLAGVGHLDEISHRCQGRGIPPIELLANPRIFEIGARWSLADCVGLSQLQLPDQEVVFNEDRLQSRDALDFVRNLAIHFIQHHPAVSAGDTAGGPGASLWEAMPLGQAAISPHRPVVRWFPENREGMPAGLQTV